MNEQMYLHHTRKPTKKKNLQNQFNRLLSFVNMNHTAKSPFG